MYSSFLARPSQVKHTDRVSDFSNQLAVGTILLTGCLVSHCTWFAGACLLPCALSTLASLLLLPPPETKRVPFGPYGNTGLDAVAWLAGAQALLCVAPTLLWQEVSWGLAGRAVAV